MIVRLAPSVASDAAELGMASISQAHADLSVALQHPTRIEHRGVTDMHHLDLSIEMVAVLAEWCRRNSYVPPGATTANERHRARRLARASDALHTELARLSRHPAYKGTAVVGTDRTVFPGWRCGSAEVYPTATMAVIASDGEGTPERVWLVPESAKVGGRTVTLWSATTDRPVTFA